MFFMPQKSLLTALSVYLSLSFSLPSSSPLFLLSLRLTPPCFSTPTSPSISLSSFLLRLFSHTFTDADGAAAPNRAAAAAAAVAAAAAAAGARCASLSPGGVAKLERDAFPVVDAEGEEEEEEAEEEEEEVARRSSARFPSTEREALFQCSICG